jgi:DNA primase
MSETDEIKARLDIVDFISEYVPLKKAGRNYKALCPFHSEKTPSFVVFPDTQTWRCFGACNEGGDIFSFAMKQEAWNFAEALRALAERAGVTLRPRGKPEQADAFDRLRELLAEVTTYYHHLLLNSPQAAGGRDYVERRGLNAETIHAFMLGYAPESWDATRKHLQTKGYSEQEIVDAGLMVVREEESKRYDRFRHRLMIPIRDGRGRTLGFGARALEPDDQPKYLNSPQGALFDKGRVLFGLDMARRSIREQETAILVEGYMDVMQAHQAGCPNVVAQMGTALTEAQLRQLSKYARRLILALDPDVAGVQATLHGLEVARTTLTEQRIDAKGMILWGGRLNMDIRILSLPQGMDPDDLIRQQPDTWQRLVDEALPMAEYVIRQATRGRDLRDAFERERIARALLPMLCTTESQLQNESNAQALARALHMSEETMVRMAREYRGRPARGRRSSRPRLQERHEEGPPSPGAVAEKAPPTTKLERYCLAALVRRPDLVYRANRRLQEIGLPRLGTEDFNETVLQEIFRAFQASLAQDAQESPDYMRAVLPAALVEELEALLRSEALDDLWDERVLDDTLAGLLRLRRRNLRRWAEEVRFLQAQALEAGDLTAVKEQGSIVSRYTQELQRLQRALPYDKSAVRQH